MSEPTPAPAPQSGSGRGSGRVLEIAVFAAVFVGGGVATWMAAEEERPQTVKVRPPPRGPLQTPEVQPPIVPVIPTIDVPGVIEDAVIVATARTEENQAGCTVHLRFIWELEPSTAPPNRSEAVITLAGGNVDGEYRERVVNGTVALEVDLDIAGGSATTANLVTVDGREVLPNPLSASYTAAAC
jgi:hypothetical protein